MSLTKVTYSMINGSPANVLDFGAVGDGVTDDTVAIQTALAATKAIYFPVGTYKVTDQLITKGHTLFGEFAETFTTTPQTIILFSDMPAVDACLVNELESSSYYNITFKHDTWNGGTPEISGLHIKRFVYAERCSFSSFPGYGVFAYGTTSVTLSPYNSVFQSCFFDYNKKHGVVLGNGANLIAVKDCFVRWSGAPSYETAPSVAGLFDGIYLDGEMPEFPVGLTNEPQGCVIQGGDISYNSRYGINYRRCTDCTQLGSYLEDNKSGFEENVADTFGLTVINAMTLNPFRFTDFVQNDPVTPSRNARTFPNHITRRGAVLGEGSLNPVTNKFNVYFANSMYTAGTRYFSVGNSGEDFEFGTVFTNARVKFDANTRPVAPKFYLGGSLIADADNAFLPPAGVAEDNVFFNLVNQNQFSTFYCVNAGGANAADTHVKLAKHSVTNRTINAGGTVNAAGTDYAEYMRKSSLDIVFAKGDIVGINKNGELTNVFLDAIAFAVKSTNPSYVGGDTWANEDVIGSEPKPEPQSENESNDDYVARYDEFYKTNAERLSAWKDRIEAERQWVDRIAFSGQVPVNVTTAQPGDYIVPVDDNGSVKGIAVSNPTFEQYQVAVGKVIAIEDDGRAKIIVKIC